MNPHMARTGFGTAPTGRLTTDGTIHALAARQHGVVTRSQLRHEGVGDDAIDGRIARGLLRPLHRGVFGVGPVESTLAPEMAALLACGPQAWIGHFSAARMYLMLPPAKPACDIHVLTRDHHRRHGGIRLHRVPGLRPDEVTRLHGIAITRPSRTLIDLAGSASPRELERALAEALALRLVTLAGLRKHVDRLAGNRGTAALRALLDSPPAVTRSEAEARFLLSVRRARLPAPETNVRVAGFEVDFLWRKERLIVEIDGYAFHGASAAFENDRRRDLTLTASGMRVVRITWRQLTREPEAVIVSVAQALVSSQ
jgi:very-short-patch-repair endonuclease